MAFTTSRRSCTLAAAPGTVRLIRQAVKTGSIKAQRASETSVRYGRRALTHRVSTTNPIGHTSISDHHPSRFDALTESAVQFLPSKAVNPLAAAGLDLELAALPDAAHATPITRNSAALKAMPLP